MTGERSGLNVNQIGRQALTSEVIVQLDAESARCLQSQGGATNEVKQLYDTTSALGISLSPQHPGETDPDLSRFFVADVPKEADSERILEALRRLPAVQAAYLKPEAELP